MRKTNVYECWCGTKVFVELDEDSEKWTYSTLRDLAFKKHLAIHKFQPLADGFKKRK